MPGMRDIKRRIKSVKNTQQITKAMKMVSAAKLHKAQTRVVAARPYAQKTSEVLAGLAGVPVDEHLPLLESREVKKVAYVLVTADRGFCGGYNTNIIKACRNSMQSNQEPTSLIAIGRKGRDFFKRLGTDITAEYIGLGDEPDFLQSKHIAQQLIDLYTAGVFDKIYLVYTEFVSALTQRPVVMQLLPIEAPTGETAGPTQEYIYEPSAGAVLNTLLPKYVQVNVYRALLEAKASEHGARMTAMGSATDNAAEIIRKLTLSFNRARQAAITKEIAEIVGGANAIGG